MGMNKSPPRINPCIYIRHPSYVHILLLHLGNPHMRMFWQYLATTFTLTSPHAQDVIPLDGNFRTWDFFSLDIYMRHGYWFSVPIHIWAGMIASGGASIVGRCCRDATWIPIMESTPASPSSSSLSSSLHLLASYLRHSS